MRYIFSVFLIMMALNVPGEAQGAGPPIAGSSTVVSCTERPGTVTSGGTAIQAAASNASRKLFWITNPPAATEALTFSVSGTATAASTSLPPGGGFSWPPGTISTAAISVFAASTGHAFTVVECQ